MNNITLANSNLTMTSREIAKLTEKQHFHVMRDIRALENELGDLFNGSIQNWIHPQNGQEYEEFVLDKDTCLTLLLGYDAVARLKVVKRWQELEAQNQKPSIENLSRLDILQIAMQSEQERLRLEQQTQELEQKIEEQAPHVEFAKRVEVAPDAISVAQAAKILGTGQHRLFAFLRQLGWITRRNEPYQARIELGHLDVKIGTWSHPEQGLQKTLTTLITGKGLVLLQKLWNKHHPNTVESVTSTSPAYI